MAQRGVQAGFRAAVVSGACTGHGCGCQSDLPLCDDCLGRATSATAALIYDYVDLEQMIARVGAAGEPISGTRDPILPISLGVEALQRHIWHTTTLWEGIVITRERLSPPPAGDTRDGWAVQRAVRLLVAWLPALAAYPAVPVYPDGLDGPEAVVDGRGALDALTRTHQRARSVLGLTRLTHSLPGECPRSECGKLALCRDDGSDTVWCLACDHRETIDDYERRGRLT